MLALLYGQYYRPSEKNFSEERFIYRPEDNNIDEKEKIPLGIFSLKEYADVSAIVFSSTVSLGKLSALCSSSDNKIIHVWYDGDLREPFKITIDKKEKLTDGLFVFHNPLAKKPLPISVFECENICQFYSDKDGIITSKSPHAHLVGRGVAKIEDKHYLDNLDELLESAFFSELMSKAYSNYNYYYRGSDVTMNEK
ncbi:hypothetical protein ACQXSR_005753 [Escherichia coli]